MSRDKTCNACKVMIVKPFKICQLQDQKGNGKIILNLAKGVNKSVNKGLYTTSMIVDCQSNSEITDKKLSLCRKFPFHTIYSVADTN
jgi:hypothetical protein